MDNLFYECDNILSSINISLDSELLVATEESLEEYSEVFSDFYYIKDTIYSISKDIQSWGREIIRKFIEIWKSFINIIKRIYNKIKTIIKDFCTKSTKIPNISLPITIINSDGNIGIIKKTATSIFQLKQLQIHSISNILQLISKMASNQILLLKKLFEDKMPFNENEIDKTIIEKLKTIDMSEIGYKLSIVGDDIFDSKDKMGTVDAEKLYKTLLTPIENSVNNYNIMKDQYCDFLLRPISVSELVRIYKYNPNDLNDYLPLNQDDVDNYIQTAMLISRKNLERLFIDNTEYEIKEYLKGKLFTNIKSSSDLVDLIKLRMGYNNALMKNLKEVIKSQYLVYSYIAKTIGTNKINLNKFTPFELFKKINGYIFTHPNLFLKHPGYIDFKSLNGGKIYYNSPDNTYTTSILDINPAIMYKLSLAWDIIILYHGYSIEPNNEFKFESPINIDGKSFELVEDCINYLIKAKYRKILVLSCNPGEVDISSKIKINSNTQKVKYAGSDMFLSGTFPSIYKFIYITNKSEFEKTPKYNSIIFGDLNRICKYSPDKVINAFNTFYFGNNFSLYRKINK